MGDSTIQTVESPEGVEITMKTDVVCHCPVGHGIDRYDVTLRYISEGTSIECKSLQTYLDGFADEVLSQEQVTDRIGGVCNDALPEATVRVTVTGEHSGIALESATR